MAAACWPAHAQPGGPLHLRAESALSYESNVLRLADDISAAMSADVLDGREKGAFVTSLGAGARAEIPVSRQRYRADVLVTRHQYLDFDELDYTGYAASGAWDWRAGNDWQGELSAGTRQERRASSSAAGVLVPRLQQRHDALLDARYALTARWQLQASASALEIGNRDPEFRSEDFRRGAASLGALYRTPRRNSVGARLRYENGEWPGRSPASVALFGNDYRQHTVSALLDWRPTARSRMQGEAGYTSRDRGAAVSRDFAGPTGSLTYERTLTGKLGLRGTVYETRGATDNFTATYVKIAGLELAGTYRASAKIALEATAGVHELDYLGDSLAPGVEQRRDELATLRLAGTFRATRTLTFSAAGQYDQRKSNASLGDYHIYTIFLRAGIEI